jgi:hypothetical protein
MSVPMAKCPTFFSEVPQAAQQKHSPCRGRPKVTLKFTSKKRVIKVDILGGSGRRQMLGNGLAPWRSMFIYILNLQFLCQESLSVSACYSRSM